MDADKEALEGFGYAWTPYRVEWRPRHAPHSRDELLRVLDSLADAGVEAWWYSVSAKGSFPLFRSKVLPYVEDVAVDDDFYPWLVEQAHQRHLALFSWEYLNTAPLLTEQHPEWRYRYLDYDVPCDEYDERTKHYICHNSPYGDLLKDFCVEVTGDLGLDGIWFDGSYLFSTGNQRIACCCEFCNRRFRQDTGSDIPRRLDLGDRTCREFLQWRYQDSARYWRELSGYVREQVPKALIALNHFNRMHRSWESGSPWRRMSMPAMIATEADGQLRQVPLMHAILREINPGRPTEVWQGMQDAAADSYVPARPSPNPSAMIFHAQLSAACGGFGSFGQPRSPCDVVEALKAMTDTLRCTAPCTGGTAVDCVGLVTSGATRDFGTLDAVEERKGGDSADGHWEHALGLGGTLGVDTFRTCVGTLNLLRGLHWPTGAVLDDMLEDPAALQRYQALVLPNVTCISDVAANSLRAYIANGGVLLLLGGDCGTRNALGDRRHRGAIDDVLGIVWRDDTLSHPEVTLADPHRFAGLPSTLVLGGSARLVRTEGADVLAIGIYRHASLKEAPKHWGKGGLLPVELPETTGDTVVHKTLGKGHIYLVAHDLGLRYADQPVAYNRQLVGALLAPHLYPPLTTDAPPAVWVCPWRLDDGRLALHILNLPDALLCFRGPRPDPYWPEDITPTGPFSITVRGKWRTVSVPSPDLDVSIRSSDGEAALQLPSLHRHGVIVLTPAL